MQKHKPKQYMHQDIKESEVNKMGILREFGLDDFYDNVKLVDDHKDVNIIRGVTTSKNIPIQFLRPTGLIGQRRGLLSEDWISHNNIFVGAGALTPITASARGMGGAVGTLGPQKVKTNIVADPFPKTPVLTTTGKGIPSRLTTPSKVFTTPPPKTSVPNPTKPPIKLGISTSATRSGLTVGQTAANYISTKPFNASLQPQLNIINKALNSPSIGQFPKIVGDTTTYNPWDQQRYNQINSALNKINPSVNPSREVTASYPIR